MEKEKQETEDEASGGTLLAWLMNPLFLITTFIPETWEDAKWLLGTLAVVLIVIFVFAQVF